MKTKQDLEYISTDDLIEELANRHTELIVIRNHQKNTKEDKVFVKTGFGKKGKKDKGFDLVEVTSILHAAHWQLIYDYMDEAD